MGLSSLQARRLLLIAQQKGTFKSTQDAKDENKAEKEKTTNKSQNTEVKDTTTKESISTKDLPTDILLANKGINITTENKIEQPFQNFSDEADSTSQEIKSTNTEKDIQSPFNLFG